MLVKRMKPLIFVLIVAVVLISTLVNAAATATTAANANTNGNANTANPTAQPSPPSAASPPPSTTVPTTQQSGSSVPTTTPTTTTTTSFAIPGNKSFKKQLLNLSKLFQKPWLRDLFDPLTLLLISPQSSGKSMFLSILIGFPIAPSGIGATTMFPILYILRDSDLMGSEYCRVDGKDIPLENVFEYVKDLNDKQHGNPSDQQIEIEISRPGLVNLNILDLPGYPGKDLEPQLYATVKPMLQKYAKKENSLIVTIGDGSNPDHTNVGHSYASVNDILDSVRPNWKQEVICIKNRVNKALEDMLEVKQLNAYFDPSHRTCAHEFYAPFRSSRDLFDPSTKTIEEYRQWLLAIRDGGEEQLFFNEIERIVKEENKKMNRIVLADHVKQAPLGVKTIGPHLQEISMNIFAKQLPAMKEKLLKEIHRYHQQSDALTSELDSNKGFILGIYYNVCS